MRGERGFHGSGDVCEGEVVGFTDDGVVTGVSWERKETLGSLGYVFVELWVGFGGGFISCGNVSEKI